MIPATMLEMSPIVIEFPDVSNETFKLLEGFVMAEEKDKGLGEQLLALAEMLKTVSEKAVSEEDIERTAVLSLAVGMCTLLPVVAGIGEEIVKIRENAEEQTRLLGVILKSINAGRQ